MLDIEDVTTYLRQRGQCRNVMISHWSTIISILGRTRINQSINQSDTDRQTERERERERATDKQTERESDR